MSREVAVIGGGPAGLYAARLLKLADPTVEVVVHERTDEARETFGFGVGLTESTMRNLEAADAETAEQVRAASFAGHNLELRGTSSAVTLHGARNLAIGRATLLDILTRAATAVGVDVRRSSKVDATSVKADVVIAADGVRSATREKLAADLGVSSSLGRTRFVWCGAGFAVDSAFFSSVETERGLFVAHAYPYAADRSTFLIEVDEETWDTAGLAAYDAATPVGQTDEASVRLLESVFADDLGGRPLLTNRTRWGRFTNLSLDRWSAGNAVLLGDAAHTAHYTLGSGTKLALEDSIALAEALAGDASIEAAFAQYEARRRPPVERFKLLAGRSQAWWDSYRLRADWPVELLALSYMTRSGNLTMSHYASDQLQATRDALAWLDPAVPPAADQLDDWVLSLPLRHADAQFPQRGVAADVLRNQQAGEPDLLEWTDDDVWGEPADRVVQQLTSSPRPFVLVTGPDDPSLLGARIDLAERLGLQTQRCVGVALPASERAQAAATVAARRAHFVVFT